MKNTIKCCIACILPCGSLDVIRIVHTNGHVEEISGTVKAAEIMKLHPKHVLKKPPSSSDDGACPKIVVVPPDVELQRGKIYFLMPLPPLPEKNRSRSMAKRKSKKKVMENKNIEMSGGDISGINTVLSDRYLTEILSENSAQRDQRRGRAAVWRPNLESICETPAA